MGLVWRVRGGEDINLMCYCAPKACHGDVLKEFIESMIVKPIRVIVAGSRTFDNYQYLEEKMLELLEGTGDPVEIVSGTAKGADQFGEKFAAKHGLGCIRMPANWDQYGKRAGYLRNEQMAEIGDALVAFWDGESRGTKHMIDIAKGKGLAVHTFTDWQ
jgi:hypothetical protein